MPQTFMQCQLCHRRTRIPPDIAAEIAAGIVKLTAYVCPRCATTPEGKAILATWPEPEQEMVG